MILRDRSMLYRMAGLCAKLCDQKWPKSKAFYFAFIFISNGSVSGKRDFLEKLKGAVSRVSSFHATCYETWQRKCNVFREIKVEISNLQIIINFSKNAMRQIFFGNYQTIRKHMINSEVTYFVFNNLNTLNTLYTKLHC